MQRFSGRILLVGGLAAWLAWGAGCGARDASPAGTPAHPEPAHGDGAGAGEADLAALEMQAYENARPVFDKHCGACHTGPARDAEHEHALEHFSMDSYPFGGDHAHELGEEIREALGVNGATATMPPANPGAVQGEELAAILAWADAFDKAQAERSGGEAHHEGHEGDEAGGEHGDNDEAGEADEADEEDEAGGAGHSSAALRSFRVVPGKFAELNLTLDQGATARVDYEAGAALAWNIHSHEAGKTVIHRQGSNQRGTLAFTAARAGGYSYLWHNQGASETPLQVSLATGAGVSVHSWHPAAAE